MAGRKFPYKSAFVACNGGCHSVSCQYGCIACSKCVTACRFGAIYINKDNVAEVDEGKCIACGACVRLCPQHIISLKQVGAPIRVRCSNHDKGADARKACSLSCIACSICERVCTAGAVHVIDNCSIIDEEMCLSCGMCLVRCPRGTISDSRGIL